MSATPDLPHRGDTRAPAAAGAREPARPGWIEVVVGVAVLMLLAFVGLPLIKQLGLDPVVYGLIVAAWSGVAAIAGFAAARSVRVRTWTAFNVRATSWRWLALGVCGGLLAFVVVRLATVLYTEVFGIPSNVQEVYTDTGTSGPAALVLSLLFLAVLTPLGEELLFRGVVTTVFLRYGRAVGVLGSAVVFAAAHGPNAAAIPALIVGVISAELRRRSRSIWPGVVVHAVNNFVGIGLGILVAAAS